MLASDLFGTISGRLQGKYPALQNRWYRTYLSYQVVSNIGSWMQTVSLPLFTLALTNDIAVVGMIAALQAVPLTLFGIFMGSVSDSISRKHIVLVSQIGFCLLSLLLSLAVFANLVTLPFLFITVLLIGLLSLASQSAQATLYAEVLKSQDVENASALSFIVFNFSRIVGPVLAALVVTEHGFGWAFLINALSYLPMILLFVRLPATVGTRRAAMPRFGELLTKTREGVAYTARHPVISPVMFQVMIMGILGFNFSVLLPTLLSSSLGGNDNHYGLMIACLGFGSLLGTIVSAEKAGDRFHIADISKLPYMTGALLCLLGMAPSLTVATVTIFLLGLVNLLFFSKARGVVFAQAGPTYIGRVNSLYGLCFAGMSPVGNVLAGFAGKHVGPSSAFLLTGGLVAALALLGHRLPGLRSHGAGEGQ